MELLCRANSYHIALLRRNVLEIRELVDICKQHCGCTWLRYSCRICFFVLEIGGWIMLFFKKILLVEVAA